MRPKIVSASHNMEGDVRKEHGAKGGGGEEEQEAEEEENPRSANTENDDSLLNGRLSHSHQSQRQETPQHNVATETNTPAAAPSLNSKGHIHRSQDKLGQPFYLSNGQDLRR